MIAQELYDKLGKLSHKDLQKPVSIILVRNEGFDNEDILVESVFGISTELVPGKFSIDLEGVIVEPVEE